MLSEINIAIRKILADKYIDEAIGLVKLSSESYQRTLLSYSNCGNENLFCMTLDSIKNDLFMQCKIEKVDFPNFGLNF